MSNRGCRRPPRVQTLSEVVERIAEAGDGGQRVRIGEILDHVGPRSYGPMLLMPSILVVSPLSAVPGFSSLVGACLILVAGQMLIGRHGPWLPGFLVNRSIDHAALRRGGKWSGKVAKQVDRVIGPRLEFLTMGPFARAIAAVCLLMASVIPLLELVPTASSVVGAVIAVYGLALSAHDGLLSIVAMAMTVAAGVFVASMMM